MSDLLLIGLGLIVIPAFVATLAGWNWNDDEEEE